ncbi:MAG: methyltransferase domain-containing protein [Halolamina sp.]|uniref:class I SAM-dependent methyltransferase n=1 Tax=Halolamina sp. TaxID=1940283 RepID=UPI002FC37E26
MSSRYGRGDVGAFDRFAPLYDPLMPSAGVQELHEGFAFANRPVRRVLDLAGGTGRVADALRREAESRNPDPDGDDNAPGSAVAEPIVVDISAPMLARAHERGLATVRADASTLPFRDGGEETDAAIDAIVIVDAYHHLPDQPAALAEAARVLAPGGVVVIRDFDPETLVGRAIETGEALFGMGSQFVDVDGAAAALSRAGLHSRVVERGSTYTVVGRRPREN